MAGNFANTDQVAIGGSNENFLSRIEIFRPQRLFNHGESGFRRNLQKNAARNAFQAAGTEWRGKDLAIFHCEDVCRRAFRHLAALVEHHHFVEAFFVGFGDGPNVIEPGDGFHSCQRRSGVAPMRAQSQADDLPVLGQASGVND